MLIIFHYFGVFLYQILKNRKRLKLETYNENVTEKELENIIKFDPPVYRQRYGKVCEVLLEEKLRNNLKKLVDFGCAEFGFFTFIKNLNLSEIMFVDIDEYLLEENLGRLQPLLGDQLNRRYSPLEVTVFKGSVSDPDYRLRKTDVVTAIELIEHLYPDTLDAFCYNIFSYIEPKIVIITTPNADFNVVFKKLKQFRHPDHKFEWSREQFQDWCENIIQRFPDYTVEYCGIGEYSEETKSLGCCSQMALFKRKDVENEKYISGLYAKTCCCDISSSTKGHKAVSKRSCKCVCPLCVPDYSVGVCTYCSFSELSRETINIKEDNNVYSSNSKQENVNINPLYNIFYKCILKIEYPFQIDSRSEEERLLDIFKYRIYAYSFVNSRFFIEEKERCEIPVTDLMYGDIHMSEDELSNLLIKSEYKLEPCIIQNTQLSKNCIITLPHEMEDITSSSDITEDYSSRSEANDVKFEENLESESDWDETSSMKASNILKQGTPVDIPKPKPDPLFDSGYLNSPSPLETIAKLPHQELPETDQFEEKSIYTNKDNKSNKKSIQKDKFVVSPTVEINRTKIDPDRVNELDRYRTSTKNHINNQLRQDIKRNAGRDQSVKSSFLREPSVAGPSGWKRSIKQKDLQKKKTFDKNHHEPSHLDDAKSITDCIIQNSLNKIEVDEEIYGYRSDLIKNLEPQQAFREQDVEIPNEQPQQLPQNHLQDAPALMENSDVANNNRDNEGNNFPANNNQDVDVDEGIDLLNDNLEELAQFLEDNIHIPDNNNEIPVEVNAVEGQNVEMDAAIEPEPEAEEDCGVEDEVVAYASREVLFDVNSEPDLLEDFDIPPQSDETSWRNLETDVVFIGFEPCTSQDVAINRDNGPVSVETSTNNFPQWLLQIFGSQVNPDEIPVPPLNGTQDEPHFYCQGDGLGVHPSVVAVEIDEAEDADDSTEESSSNNTGDFAEAGPGPSGTFDSSSLPEESNSGVDDINTSHIRLDESIIWPETISDNGKFEEVARELMDEIIDAAETEVDRISTSMECSRSMFSDASERSRYEEFCSVSSTLSEEPRPRQQETRIIDESDGRSSLHLVTMHSSNISQISSESTNNSGN